MQLNPSPQDHKTAKTLSPSSNNIKGPQFQVVDHHPYLDVELTFELVRVQRSGIDTIKYRT